MRSASLVSVGQGMPHSVAVLLPMLQRLSVRAVGGIVVGVPKEELLL